ncbi:hypothetical protein [Streptomyces sp. NPDC048172]|uniref:hypothetical protein n=1 Tax=Streptomyces sp. NPDC048172 TaxID=3365505 RepID=UPI00371C84AE
MEDERPEATHHHPDAPWWAGTGPAGAVAMIVFGAAAALWLYLRLPGTPDADGTLPGMFYGAAKVAALGLVLSGGAALNRFRRPSGAAGGR